MVEDAVENRGLYRVLASRVVAYNKAVENSRLSVDARQGEIGPPNRTPSIAEWVL